MNEEDQLKDDYKKLRSLTPITISTIGPEVAAEMFQRILRDMDRRLRDLEAGPEIIK